MNETTIKAFCRHLRVMTIKTLRCYNIIYNSSSLAASGLRQNRSFVHDETVLGEVEMNNYHQTLRSQAAVHNNITFRINVTSHIILAFYCYSM